jgi:hypothetical protein
MLWLAVRREELDAIYDFKNKGDSKRYGLARDWINRSEKSEEFSLEQIASTQVLTKAQWQRAAEIAFSIPEPGCSQAKLELCRSILSTKDNARALQVAKNMQDKALRHLARLRAQSRVY